MAKEIPEDVRDKIGRLQQMQQQGQILSMQKQNFTIQLTEIENALRESQDSEEGELYKIVGTVMLKKTKKELVDSLNEKKEIINLRLKSINKQLQDIEKKAKDIQESLAKMG